MPQYTTPTGEVCEGNGGGLALPKPLIMANIFFSKRNQHMALITYRDT